MRKFLIMSLTAVLIIGCVAAFSRPASVSAQGGALEFGQWVEGTLTAAQYEQTYTFTGTAGDIVMVEMAPKPGTYDLDPAMLLRDSSGAIIGQNDDFAGFSAVIVAELAADGEYSILATRSGGATGSSEGPFVLRVSQVDLLAPGASVTATLYSDTELDIPTIFVLRPQADATWAFSFSRETSELYPSLELSAWSADASFGETVFELGDTAKVRSGTLNVDLTGGQFYVLTVDTAFSSFTFETVEAQVVITVAEAAQ